MSADEEGVADTCCANCGIKEIDDVKLKDCDKCDLARYCGDKCQEDHREKHEEICNKRAAELREEILFKQPESSCYGDCPICFLPLPLDQKKSTLYFCCYKWICDGCQHAKMIRELEQRLKHNCPFCRTSFAKMDKEWEKRLMERAEANDPIALRGIASRHHEEGDYEEAVKYYTRAAEVGYAIAHFDLSCSYHEGDIVEKDEEKAVYHAEEAAIAGHPVARYNLGLHEGKNGRLERAVKHWIIAANLGDNDSLQALKLCYKDGYVNKDDLAATLRAYQAAVDATKSPQREVAVKIEAELARRHTKEND